MITKWEDLVGKTVTGVYYHSGGSVLLLDDEFAVIVGKEDYEGGAFADLASQENGDALIAANAANAPGAKQLMETHANNFIAETQARERRRLAYLKEKYNDETT